MRFPLVSLFALFLVLFSAGNATSAKTPPETGAPVENQLPPTCYLFAYFTGNGEKGLRLAWSRDGLNWEALRGGRSFLRPQVGDSKLMRDPCIAQGPDGTFHMVWTDGWEGQTIGYAASSDLVHWSPQRALPVMQSEPTTLNCWAPEIIYDSKKKHFLIFWASTIPGRFPQTEFGGRNDNNHRIYSTTTRDFQSFTPTRLLFNPGFNVIDSTLLRNDGKILMFFKDETNFPRPRKNLRWAIAKNYEGPYQVQTQEITPVGAWVEGPTTLQVGDVTYLYFDLYTRGRYGALRSRDFKNWEDVTDQLNLPRGVRHGTAFPVSADIMGRLLEHNSQ